MKRTLLQLGVFGDAVSHLTGRFLHYGETEMGEKPLSHQPKSDQFSLSKSGSPIRVPSSTKCFSLPIKVLVPPIVT